MISGTEAHPLDMTQKLDRSSLCVRWAHYAWYRLKCWLIGAVIKTIDHLHLPCNTQFAFDSASECHQRKRLWSPLTRDPRRPPAVRGPHPQKAPPTPTNDLEAGPVRMLLLLLPSSPRHHHHPHPRTGRSMYTSQSFTTNHFLFFVAKGTFTFLYLDASGI